MMNRREMGKMLVAAAGVFVADAAGAFGAEKPVGKAMAQQHRQERGAMRSMDSVGVHDLLVEPLGQMDDPEVTMLTLTLAPGSNSEPHRHTGPVFAYILEGTIENQVDPEPPKRYKPGGYFYEPPMHVHRMMKNLSATEHAKVLVVQVGEKGKKFTIPA